MARVALPRPEDTTDPAIDEIFAWVTEMEGSVPNHFFVELNFPEFFVAKLGATKVLWQMGELSMDEIQRVGILVSQANGCAYCTAAFCTILNFGLGTAEDEVAALLKEGLENTDDDRVFEPDHPFVAAHRGFDILAHSKQVLVPAYRKTFGFQRQHFWCEAQEGA